MSNAFREGWERIFGHKVQMIRNPLPIRSHTTTAHYEIPDNLTMSEWWRISLHLLTMSQWEPDMGWPEYPFKRSG